MSPRLPHHRRRPGIEIVRHPDGPIEIQVSGLMEAAERRLQRWRAAFWLSLVGIVLAASAAIAVLALRWDYQRGQALQLLRADVEVARARARCWEALARYLPESPKDVIPDANRGEWVNQCMAVELARFNPKR
ncbi:MAG: hypothetical protein HYY64_09360 [Candidatus Rokubacteria bacterium]|nr:hypothetical protein [Candidatus Rokubacteria bacterium]